MKNFIFFTFAFISLSSWASEDCKNQAQEAVEMREDYKSYAELLASIEADRAFTYNLTGEVRARADGRLRNMQIQGELVFKHSKGLKGAKLYKFTYDECIAYEKSISDRAARQAAREAAKAAKAAKNEN